MTRRTGHKDTGPKGTGHDGRTGRRTLSIHLRLFLGFGGALVACSVLMVAVIYVGIRYVPTYDLTTPVVVPSPTAGASATPSSIPPHTVAPSADASVLPGQKIDTTGLVRDKEDVWASVLAISIGGLLLVTAVGLTAGWLLSRRLLAPLHTISRAAARAGEGDLAYRIDAQGPHDELRQLADTFDTTLARLEESFAAHQRFAANASHELLTPLTTARAALQLAASDPSGASFAELVPMLAETNERNIRIVEELLALAAADHVEFDGAPVDLAALAREVAEEAGRAPGTPTVTCTTEADCAVRGNATLLRHLVANLVGNAVTHNTIDGGGFVTVEVRAGDPDGGGRDDVVLEVVNSGPGVEPGTVERLFEPFQRAAERVGSERGHGLGLALVRSVTRAHAGSVTATARPAGGLVVRVRLPRAGA
ncbi:HAMP domain-containing sensor histidine kinase [Streptomyces sp. NPDC046716]|uniref:sensor histidine kinase n=1 Tax=Streptomyces sp. NPDC046716 TaxID=3157093 RepID=UPI0033C2418F